MTNFFLWISGDVDAVLATNIQLGDRFFDQSGYRQHRVVYLLAISSMSLYMTMAPSSKLVSQNTVGDNAKAAHDAGFLKIFISQTYKE